MDVCSPKHFPQHCITVPVGMLPHTRPILYAISLSIRDFKKALAFLLELITAAVPTDSS
jgi:hypothetical protein